MHFSDFLKAVQIIRMLYGWDIAKDFFEKNQKQFDKIFDFNYSETNQSIKSCVNRKDLSSNE